ncbi:hypothetical protein [Blastococcus brunescens]|uniref:Uncharacterized protein n=1 Tax=Blastococcus brunescens TaxID=1564165 RepID=A0ABZ1AVX8_9ACTN|nr:hypothetical protein [Blastococcus sp. BMG 8361]WRL62297.1 hypothetical protein U6N30_19955 [Blastococcus sp. BMG 8361]
MRGAVAAAADVLLAASSEPDTTGYPIRRSTLVSLGEMRERATAAVAETTATIGSIEALTAQLRDWADPDAAPAGSPQ